MNGVKNTKKSSSFVEAFMHRSHLQENKPKKG
jgi:hypothetical protein